MHLDTQVAKIHMCTRLHYWVHMFTLQCILVVVTKVYMFLRSFAGVLVAVIGASNYGASNYDVCQ